MKFFIVFVALVVFLNNGIRSQQVKQSSATQILKFLQSIPADAKEEMDAILRNTTFTKDQVEKKLQEWANKQPGDFPSQYNKIKDLLNSQSNVPAVTVSNTAEQSIANIRQNKSITRLEERKAILVSFCHECLE